VQKIENTIENTGFAGNSKREKFHNKIKDKEETFGLDEPRRFINSKKIASSENPNTEERKLEEEGVQNETEYIPGELNNNENKNYGTEYRK